MCKAMDSPEHSLPLEMKGIMKVHVIRDSDICDICLDARGMTGLRIDLGICIL